MKFLFTLLFFSFLQLCTGQSNRMGIFDRNADIGNQKMQDLPVTMKPPRPIF